MAEAWTARSTARAARLGVADELGAKSVAYPLISSGIYRWPKDDAVAQALTALRAEPTTIELVRLVLFDEQTRKIAERVLEGDVGS